jgi:hypothetical protein
VNRNFLSLWACACPGFVFFCSREFLPEVFVAFLSPVWPIFRSFLRSFVSPMHFVPTSSALVEGPVPILARAVFLSFPPHAFGRSTSFVMIPLAPVLRHSLYSLCILPCDVTGLVCPICVGPVSLAPCANFWPRDAGPCAAACPMVRSRVIFWNSSQLLNWHRPMVFARRNSFLVR